MLIRRKQQHHYGYSLIELMTTLVITGLILIALLTISTSINKHSKELMSRSELRQTLGAVISIMASDIRRSGYWANATNDLDSGANTNPFMAVGTDVFINPANNCIILSYDTNKNGVLPDIGTAPDDERYGFRLYNNFIQARPLGTSFSCDSAENMWEDLTDPNIINVTSLSFTPNYKTIALSGGGQFIIRNITILITASLTDDATMTAAVTKTIRVRNSKYVP